MTDSPQPDWRHGMLVKHESYFNEMWKHCRVLPFDSCKLYESNQNNLPSLGMCKIILATNYLIFLQISNNLRLQLGSKARPKVERCDKKIFKDIWRHIGFTSSSLLFSSYFSVLELGWTIFHYNLVSAAFIILAC